MTPDDLERVLHDRLRRLPPPAAPRTLLPRVMRAVELRARRPRPVSWFDWPIGWRVLSGTTVAALVGGLVMLWPWIAAHVVTRAASWTAPVAEFANRALALAGAGATLGRSLLQFPSPDLLLYCLLMAGACALGVTALRYVVPGGTAHP